MVPYQQSAMAVVMMAVKGVKEIVRSGSQKKEKPNLWQNREGPGAKTESVYECITKELKTEIGFYFSSMKNKNRKGKSGSSFYVSIFYDTNKDIKSSNKANAYYGSNPNRRDTSRDPFEVIHQISLVIVDISFEKFEKHSSASSRPS